MCCAVLSLTLCDPLDCSPPGFSVHGVFQARTLEWVAMPSSRGSSQPRDWTQVTCIAGRFFTVWASREAQYTIKYSIKYILYICTHTHTQFKEKGELYPTVLLCLRFYPISVSLCNQSSLVQGLRWLNSRSVWGTGFLLSTWRSDPHWFFPWSWS